MAARKPAEPAQTAVKVRTKEPCTRMIHLFTGAEFNAHGTLVEKIDGFIQAQIEAGKLEVVEE